MSLFGPTIHQHTHRSSTSGIFNVHEHRAPADESIRELRSMQDRMRDSILAAFPIESNTFKGSCIAFDSMERWGKTIIIRYDINGFSSDYRHEVPYEATEFDVVMKGLHQGLSKDIAATVLRFLIPELSKQLTPRWKGGR